MANRIHQTAIIGAEVELGDDNVIGPYTVIAGPARIGDGNYIGPHVSIGGPAEYLGADHLAGWDGEVGGPGVVIGDRNRIREFVTVNQGVTEATAVGDDCYLMGRAHLAHDVRLDDGVIVTSAVQIAGHCHVWSGANVGLGTVVHQRTTIGPGAMVGMGSAVRKEVGAFTITVGNPARTTGVNTVGLQRRGCTEESIAGLTGFLTGKDPAVPGDLPEELAALLKAWAERGSQH
ncbi:UDP-N-acetylglucosamine acyltransferase [Actinosynnema sp. NPDC047251]|uniref:UDP-N-acetylglucosamine acyltransferase n=1 Tax=Saccharothrix espanaensis (strain ATCC 51144 / DSM 44229 / JCM 9112 / NBRC 15066 / NRRL 15764) TaxID=1179773 RepID=K3W466_SACES|nr:UDP-N-acetylglucosamine acyltransferase [Saccharothrix espanaensis]CCH27477.1 UDP-N-acetylglucosamine acyltransferase [Saccharothrix espanaensis DSM 44229]